MCIWLQKQVVRHFLKKFMRIIYPFFFGCLLYIKIISSYTRNQSDELFTKFSIHIQRDIPVYVLKYQAKLLTHLFHLISFYYYYIPPPVRNRWCIDSLILTLNAPVITDQREYYFNISPSQLTFSSPHQW